MTSVNGKSKNPDKYASIKNTGLGITAITMNPMSMDKLIGMARKFKKFIQMCFLCRFFFFFGKSMKENIIEI